MSSLAARVLLLLLAVSAVGWQSSADGSAPERSMLGLPQRLALQASSQAPAKVALGKRLFFDTHLSSVGSTSCASCHRPSLAFTDGKALARGVRNQVGTRNAPSLLNAALNTTQFWDGRRPSLETQALDPLINPREQGLKDYEAVLARLRRDPAYVAAFRVSPCIVG